MREDQHSGCRGTGKFQSEREASAKPPWQLVAAFVIATNSCPGFAQSGTAEMGAELLNQSSIARKAKDRYISAVESVEDKYKRFKDRVECSRGDGPIGCTKILGGKYELTNEELDSLPPQAREFYWQNIGETRETGLSKAKERIRAYIDSSLDSTDPKGTPSNEQANRPTPGGYDAFPGVTLPEGARQACGRLRDCKDVFKAAAVANGLTNQEPATYAQAERFCNAALVRKEMADAAKSCTHFYKSRFDNGQLKQSPDGADTRSSGASTLEALIDEQKEKDVSEADRARQAEARRTQEWEWAAAQQRQRQDVEQVRMQQAEADAQRANADSATAAIVMGIIGAAAASGGREPAAVAPSAGAPSASARTSASTPYVVVPGGRAGPTGGSSGGGVSRGQGGGGFSMRYCPGEKYPRYGPPDVCSQPRR